MINLKRTAQYVSGCIAGGAVGDALGAPVEFMSLEDILFKFGPDGISNYAKAYGRKGAITDDTQMTLFTAEGLILSKVRGNIDLGKIPEFVYNAYLRWLSTQETSSAHLINQYGTCIIVDGLLITRKELYSRRAPGNSCLSALMSRKMGTTKEPINNSKGCGGVMRIAPCAFLINQTNVFDIACEIAAITHGHPTGWLAAGCLAQIIHDISFGKDLLDAVNNTIKILKTKKDHIECLTSIESAVALWKNKPISFKNIEKLGSGWIAEEALGIGIYCALASENNFKKGVRLAVNHSGDSDSTGSITGNIIGAALGIDAIDDEYLKELELLDIIMEISKDIVDRMND